MKMRYGYDDNNEIIVDESNVGGNGKKKDATKEGRKKRARKVSLKDNKARRKNRFDNKFLKRY